MRLTMPFIPPFSRLCPHPSFHRERGRVREGDATRREVAGVLLALALLVFPTWLEAHDAGGDKRLPVIGPAPAFTLISQDGMPVALGDMRGKVLAVTFIYTGCPDICPLADAEDGRRTERTGGSVRRENRLCFDHASIRSTTRRRC